MLSFLLAISVAVIFIWHLFEKYEKSPIIITRDPENALLNQLPFPAVTICNMNNVKKSEALRILKG